MKKYYPAYFCVKCNNEVSWDTRMYSGSVCPHCGNCDGSTIIDTYQKSYYWEKQKNNNKWYEFFKPSYTYHRVFK